MLSSPSISLLISAILIAPFASAAALPQSFPLASKNRPCGAGVASCKTGLCCSQWGWCGTSVWHCDRAQGCQIGFGICTGVTSSSSVVASSSAPAATTTSSSAGTVTSKSASSSVVASSSAPAATTTSSSFAYLDQPCGIVNGAIIKAYPGDGDNSRSGLCCSSSGVAGVTSDHCGTGCQSAYGRCGSSGTPLVTVGCVKPNDFAITFDDGPSIVTDSLLDYLKTSGVKATFFINGINSQAATDLNRISLYDNAATASLKRIVAEGHQVCSHTWSHQSLIDINDYNATYEMTRLNQAFKTILGKVPTCMRPPYGNINDNAANILQGLGYGPDSNGGKAGIISWNLDSVDWDPSLHGTGIPTQISDMLNEFKLQTTPQKNLGLPSFDNGWTGKTSGSPSTISLNHDTWATTADFRSNGLVIPLKTTPLAQKAIEYLKSRNFNLVRIDQCLGFPVDSMYRSSNRNDDNCGDKSSSGGGQCTA